MYSLGFEPKNATERQQTRTASEKTLKASSHLVSAWFLPCFGVKAPLIKKALGVALKSVQNARAVWVLGDLVLKITT